MGGATPSFPVDVLPIAEYESQGWGCTAYEGEWLWPACAATVHASDGTGRHHTGIDLGKSWPGIPLDAPIYATRAGTVTRIGSPWLGDQSVSIRLARPEAGACFLIYGHCDRALVKVGDHVEPGQKIALAGTKGSSTAVHLHLRADSTYDYEAPPGTDVDPTPFLEGSMSREAIAALFRMFFQLTLRVPALAPASYEKLGEHYYWADRWLDVGPDQAVMDFLNSVHDQRPDLNVAQMIQAPKGVAGPAGPPGPPGPPGAPVDTAAVAAAVIPHIQLTVKS